MYKKSYVYFFAALLIQTQIINCAADFRKLYGTACAAGAAAGAVSGVVVSAVASWRQRSTLARAGATIVGTATKPTTTDKEGISDTKSIAEELAALKSNHAALAKEVATIGEHTFKRTDKQPPLAPAGNVGMLQRLDELEIALGKSATKESMRELSDTQTKYNEVFAALFKYMQETKDPAAEAFNKTITAMTPK